MSRKHTVLAVSSLSASGAACILASVVIGMGGAFFPMTVRKDAPWEPQGPPLWISVGLWASLVSNLLGTLLSLPLLGSPRGQEKSLQACALNLSAMVFIVTVLPGMVLYEVVPPGPMVALLFVYVVVLGIYDLALIRRRARGSQETNAA